MPRLTPANILQGYRTVVHEHVASDGEGVAVDLGHRGAGHGRAHVRKHQRRTDLAGEPAQVLVVPRLARTRMATKKSFNPLYNLDSRNSLTCGGESTVLVEVPTSTFRGIF